jgi:hypothetical protein
MGNSVSCNCCDTGVFVVSVVILLLGHHRRKQLGRQLSVTERMVYAVIPTSSSPLSTT